jgi:hypothetical protein
MPNEVKLEGGKLPELLQDGQTNPRDKRRGALLADTCTEPAKKNGIEWRTWNPTNSGIAAWLMTSVSPATARIVNAAVIWKTLRICTFGKAI